MRQREPAICLGATDYSETSQVVHFLTRGAGPVRLLAKGSKRAKSKSGGAIDLFSEGDLLFIAGRGEGLGTLVEFAETVAHNALRKEASALDAGLFMIEAAGRLLGADDPHPEVFDLLHNSLNRLGQADAPRPAVLAYFLWRLLRHAGLLGELRVCVSCGRKLGDELQPASFSSSLGGMLCRDCEGEAREKYRLDAVALEGLAALAAAEAAPRPGGKRAALPPQQAQAVIRLLAYHIGQQTGRNLRMARHYKA
jgi:DNA repair protein RecO (recombination protein O)